MFCHFWRGDSFLQQFCRTLACPAGSPLWVARRDWLVHLSSDNNLFWSTGFYTVLTSPLFTSISVVHRTIIAGFFFALYLSLLLIYSTSLWLRTQFLLRNHSQFSRRQHLLHQSGSAYLPGRRRTKLLYTQLLELRL